MHTTNKLHWSVILLSLCTANVQADQGVSIADRPRPDYDAVGERFSTLIVKPALSADVTYNDNIYASYANTVGDAIYIARPGVKIDTDWNRHALGLVAGVTSATHASHSDEDYLETNLLFNGRLDVQRESFLTVNAGIQQMHEDRTSPDSSNSWKDPAEYNSSKLYMIYKHGLNRVSLTGGAGVTKIDYSSVDLINGGTEDLSDRDRTMYKFDGRIAYELRPSVQPFVTGAIDRRVYDQSDAGRDSNGYRLGVGTGIYMGEVTSGEVFAGYMQQEYDNWDSTSGMWYGAKILWNATQLTSVQLSAQSSIEESTLATSSGINRYTGGIRVDHELLRDVLLGVFYDYTHDKYQSIETADDLNTAGIRAKYMYNRYLDAEMSYKFQDKSSDDPTREYTANVFMISLTAKY